MPSVTARKFGILSSAEASFWGSCNSISSNLKSSYRELELNCGFQVDWLLLCNKSVETDCQFGTGYLWNLATKIKERNITDLIFLDHSMNAVPLILALKGQNTLRNLRLCFHIYGCFTLNPKFWFALGKELRGIPVKFFCASERQKDIVRFFEPARESVSAVCPFPVNTKNFKFSETQRMRTRAKFGLKPGQTLILYTGRISLQKGVLRLIDEFKRLVERKKVDALLVIAGHIDDIGGSTSGISIPKGYFYQKLQRHMELLPPKTRDRIRFLGSVGAEELQGLYCAADLFTSLSLFHDEDFGMAPAEALSAGLPCLVTDWGGYAAFAIPGVACQLVSVKLTERGLSLESNNIPQMMEDVLMLRPSSLQRRNFGVQFERAFGIKSVAKVLESELCPRSYRVFNGFSWILESHVKSNQINGSFYQEVYKRYVGEQELTHVSPN